MDKARILIVEDDGDFAESLAMILEDRDCDVRVARTGEEAVSISGQEDFDLTLMDIKLPGMDGVESFDEIRKFRPDARVVMMTGYLVKDDLDRTLQDDASDLLQKPLDIERLLALVDGVRGGDTPEE
jgi:two-component system response regulator HydG